MQFWKDKASEFEKKTPEYIEEVLAKRIKHREEEIKRLDSDNTGSLKLLASKNREVSRLKEELDAESTNISPKCSSSMSDSGITTSSSESRS